MIRPFNTYGPRQSLRAIIPTIIAQALNSNQFQLGSLHPTRDFNYVSDTVNGILKTVSLERTIGEVINLGTGREVSILQLCEIVRQLVGREERVLECGDDAPGCGVDDLAGGDEHGRGVLDHGGAGDQLASVDRRRPQEAEVVVQHPEAEPPRGDAADGPGEPGPCEPGQDRAAHARRGGGSR